MLKGRLMTCPGHVRLTIHEPVTTGGLEPTVEEARALAVSVRETVVVDVGDEPAGL